MKTIKELCEDSNWLEVFGEKGCCDNQNDDVEAVGNCPADPAPARADVKKILAIHDGTPDEEAWQGVFELNDGRFLYAEGSCDYTGWD